MEAKIVKTIDKAFTKALTITHDDMLALYDRERAELMKLSKEELIEKLIGKREEVGITFI